MSGLYIHIPFCHAKCAYCDFYSTPVTTTATKYVDALIAEWNLRHSELTEPLTTLYVGGGTPSLLPVSDIERLINHVNPGDLKEMTIEANPEDVTPQWLDSVAKIGFTRVSMGVQSFDDGQLATIGRRHSGLQAMIAARTVKNSGLRFNLDLIYGLPGQSVESWERNLDIALEISPGHLSAYLLSYEPQTRLWAMRESGKIIETPDTTIFQMYDYLVASTRENGYRHYEISNFAITGHEAVHNTNYWRGTPYLGLGAAAHSYDGEIRRANPASIKKYIQSLSEDKTVYATEHEDEIDKINDWIVTRLRTDTGLALSELELAFESSLVDMVKKTAMRLIDAGSLITTDNGGIAIAESDYLRSDAIMRELIIAH